MNAEQTYKELRSRATVIADLTGAAAVLSWDQETMMPSGGTESRAHQMGALASLIHRFYTDGALGELLEDISQAFTDDAFESTEA